jgi:MFS family permease
MRTYSGSFTPLKLPNFRIYLGGQAISLMGTWMQITAQGWVVWQISHSEAALGAVALLAGLPLFVLSPWTGVIADRIDRRRLLIGTQAVMMALAFTLAFLVQTQLVQLWHIYVLALLAGVATALDFPAQQTFIGDLSGMEQIRRATTLNIMMVQLARMLGPMLAGIVLTVLGAAMAFWINGLSFIAVIISLLVVRSTQVMAAHDGKKSGSFQEALRYVRGQPRMVDLLIFATLVTFFGLATINILPSVADTVLHGDASTFGLLLGASGAGALTCTLVLLPLSQAAKRIGLIVGSAAMWMGAGFALLSTSSLLPLSMAAMFSISLGGPLVLANGMGVLQQMAPHDMRARIISLFTMVSFGLQPIASLVIGYSAETFGPQRAILYNAVALMIGAGLMLALRPGLRAWRLEPVSTMKVSPTASMVMERAQVEMEIAAMD